MLTISKATGERLLHQSRKPGTVKKASEIISLGEVQLNIFHLLMMQQNKVVDSFMLMDFLEQPNANALRVNIAKLKSKLGLEIRNIRGQGYMIENI
jgi:DNA-binding response OmpR family regulator